MSSLVFSKIRLTREDLTLSILSGVGLAFLFVWNIYPYIGNGQKYTDLVVGNLIWSDYDKDKEWQSLNLLLIGSAVFSLCISILFQYIRGKDLSVDFIKATHKLFYIAWFPAMFWLGAALVRPNASPLIMSTSSVLVILIALIVLGLSRYKEKPAYKDMMDVGFSSILILVLSAFSILAIAVTIGKFSIDFRDTLLKWSWLLVSSGVVFALLFIVSNVYFSTSIEKMKHRFHLSLLLLQAAIPFLLFVFTSKDYIYQGKILTMYKSTGLIILVVGLIALSWYMLFRRYQKLLKEREADKDTSYISVLSAAALYPIAVYISWSQYTPWLGFEVDDFHIGEVLLPWQQIIDFGKLPYVDFVPIHGLMEIAYGGLNELFYGHTAATIPLAVGLLTAIAVGLTFLAIFLFAGPIPALLLSPFIGGAMDRFYFLIPAVLFLSHPKVTGRSKVWLSVWIVVCLFSIFYNTVVGSGIALGSLPVAVYMGLKAFREERRWFKLFVGTLASIAFLILVISPLREMAFGFIHYVIDNESTNEIANGIGLFQYNIRPTDLGFAANQFQWDLLKLSWMLVALIAAVLFVCALLPRQNNPNLVKQDNLHSKYVWLVALLPITFFMIGNWALVRIDPNVLSRTGALSYIALAVFLPLIIIGFISDSTRSVRILFVALIMGTVIGIAVVPDYNVWLTKPFNSEVINKDYTLVSGKEVGLPRLGELFADPKRIKKLQSLKEAMSPFLRPGETFLDLTDHSALYFYLDMQVPVLYSADYVAANSKSYARMIKQIKKNPPPVVLIAPRISHDGGPASLRSYPLYRELVDSYVPIQIGEYTFLIRPDRIGILNNDTLETRMDLLDNVFRARDLYSIPNAWGRSWDILKERFTILYSVGPTSAFNFIVSQNGSYKPIGEDPQIFYELEQYNLSGKNVDYILLDYSCIKGTSGPDPVLELYWGADSNSLSEKTVVRFFGSGSRALIPVGAQPRWRLAKHINALRLDLQDYKSCSELSVNRIVMLKLNNLSQT